MTLPLILECGTETYHFPAEYQIFQESPYAKNHISKTLCSALLRNRSQPGQTHDECPTYRTLYVSSCNIKITFSYTSSWCRACSTVHGDHHFTQGTWCSVCCWSPSLLQLSCNVPTEAGLLWHNVDIVGETIKGTPRRIWGTVLCSQYGHSDCRSVEFYHQSLREHTATIFRSEGHRPIFGETSVTNDTTTYVETQNITTRCNSTSGYCYRHFRFKYWNGPAIQVQTLLNGLHGDTTGSQKVRFPILLPPNNFT